MHIVQNCQQFDLPFHSQSLKLNPKTFITCWMWESGRVTKTSLQWHANSPLTTVDTDVCTTTAVECITPVSTRGSGSTPTFPVELLSVASSSYQWHQLRSQKLWTGHRLNCCKTKHILKITIYIGLWMNRVRWPPHTHTHMTIGQMTKAQVLGPLQNLKRANDIIKCCTGETACS